MTEIVTSLSFVICGDQCREIYNIWLFKCVVCFMFVLRYSLRSVWWNVLTYSCKKKCIMSVYVFEWTRTVISQQYLDSMSLDSPADRNNVIKELALTAKVKVEWNNSGQVFLEGAWEHIMNVHVSVYTCHYLHWG